MSGIEGEMVKKRYMRYNVVGVGMMVEWEKGIGWDDGLVGLGG